MSIEASYLDKFIRATQKAAYGASLHVGKKDKIIADKGAVDLMRLELNKINMTGKIVIGEGEMDEAPMLYIGEILGTKKGQSLDIAVDPLEGTNFVANNLPNSFSMLAITEKGNLFSAPDTYMEKIAFGPGLPKNLLDLDNTIEENINLLSDALKKKINELTVCLLKRPRHTEIINKLKSLNVKIEYITDGDVSASILAADKSSTIDLYIGIGGAPEGVLAAAALDCLGGQMQTRLFFNNQDEEVRAKKMGVKDIRKKLNIEDMIKGDVMFCATAITDGNLLKGISKNNDKIIANTLALHKNSKIIKKVSNEFKI